MDTYIGLDAASFSTYPAAFDYQPAERTFMM